jgi:hypothetical protein
LNPHITQNSKKGKSRKKPAPSDCTPLPSQSALEEKSIIALERKSNEGKDTVATNERAIPSIETGAQDIARNVSEIQDGFAQSNRENNKDALDKYKKGDIDNPLKYKGLQDGLTELINYDAYPLRGATESSDEIRRELLRAQADLNSILTNLEYMPRNFKSVKEAESYKKKFGLKVDLLLPQLTIETEKGLGFLTKSAIVKSLSSESEVENIKRIIGSFQQKVSFALQSEKYEGVRVNDLDIPIHPLEAELLDIIEGKAPSEIIPEKYTNNHPLGAKAFFHDRYKKYIVAKVIFQDYLRKIDEGLLSSLNNFISTHPNEKSPLPPKPVRISAYSKYLKEHPSIRKKARRVSTL